MVRDKTVLTYHKIYIPSIYMFYIMCVSSILISAVLCLYSKISVVVVNIFFPVGFFFPCKNNCCIIPINWNLFFLICHHNSNHRSQKNNRCESYKQEFKPMQYCSCHCQLRIIVIPIQIKTIRRCKCDKYYHYNRTQ